MPCESGVEKKFLPLTTLPVEVSTQEKEPSPKLKTENMPASKLIQDFFCQCPLSKHTSMEVGGIHQYGGGNTCREAYTKCSLQLDGYSVSAVG